MTWHYPVGMLTKMSDLAPFHMTPFVPNKHNSSNEPDNTLLNKTRDKAATTNKHDCYKNMTIIQQMRPRA